MDIDRRHHRSLAGEALRLASARWRGLSLREESGNEGVNGRRWRAILALLLTLSPSAMAAQAQPAPAAGGVTFQGGLRSRVEAWDWFGDAEEGEYVYSGSILRLGAAQQRPRFGWQAELAAPLILGAPDDAAAPAPRGQLGLGASYYAANDAETNSGNVFLKQAYLRLGAAPGAAGQGVRLGRFEFVEGAEITPTDATLVALKRDRIGHRLLGTFAWSHVGRSFDGAHYAFTNPRWNVSAVISRPTEGVFQTDGWGELDVVTGYAAVTMRDRPGAPGEARLFLLHYLDSRDSSAVVKVDNRALPIRRADREEIGVTTLGGHYLRALPTSAGPVDLLLWGGYQLGDWGTLDHRAWAANAEIGIQPALLPSLRPWLRVGHFSSSGDSDPTDGGHETFFQNLPTPRIYSRMPFYNLMNLRDTFASLLLRPSPTFSIRTDARLLGLSAREDLWYAGGGAFEDDSFGYAGRPSGGSDDLATLLDVSADLRVSNRLTFVLYYGRAFGGDVIEGVEPTGQGASLGYIEAEYRR